MLAMHDAASFIIHPSPICFQHWYSNILKTTTHVLFLYFGILLLPFLFLISVWIYLYYSNRYLALYYLIYCTLNVQLNLSGDIFKCQFLLSDNTKPKDCLFLLFMAFLFIFYFPQLPLSLKKMYFLTTTSSIMYKYTVYLFQWCLKTPRFTEIFKLWTGDESVGCLCPMLPWLVAHDSSRYGRWLPDLWATQISSPPFMLTSLSPSQSTPSSNVAWDMWIVCTLNKGSKMKSGWIPVLEWEAAAGPL